MQKNNVTDENQCAYNDFALVKVDPAYAGTVNPTVPFWGGPNAINTTGNPNRSATSWPTCSSPGCATTPRRAASRHPPNAAGRRHPHRPTDPSRWRRRWLGA